MKRIRVSPSLFAQGHRKSRYPEGIMTERAYWNKR